MTLEDSTPALETTEAPDRQTREALAVVREQAQRYLAAMYGETWVFKAPETFGNLVERWIWAVASSAEGTLGEEAVGKIEAAVRETREANEEEQAAQDAEEDPDA